MTQSFQLLSPFDQLPLAVLTQEAKSPKGIVCIIHGMAEHKERYLPFMTQLAHAGFHSIIMDLPGHGESLASPDDLGHMEGGVPMLMKNVHALVSQAKKLWPGLPLVLFGHSMGSLIARVYTAGHDEDLDGLLLTGVVCQNGSISFAEWLATSSMKKNGPRYRSRVMDTLVLGGYQSKFLIEDKNAWLSKNQENVARYNADPLCGFSFTVSSYLTLFALHDEAFEPDNWQLNNPTIPILLLAGEDDPVIGGETSFYSSVSFIRNRGYSNTRQKLYPELRHEILQEDDKAVLPDILEFLNFVVSPGSDG